jgi:glyoxalase family protein
MTSMGIHHVTAISGPAHRNLRFYAETLGLRLVKKTVNFDDPGTYHLYYGDEAGAPGTIITFFPWEHVAPGRLGPGETERTTFRVPRTAIGFWIERFTTAGVAHDAPVVRFGETVLSFRDPDGMALALVGLDGIEDAPAWSAGGIAAENAIRGFHGATLLLAEAAPTGAVLEDVFGFRKIANEGSITRYATGTAPGGIVDLHEVGGFPRGRLGGGSVHHIAFRAASDAAQKTMVEQLAARGITTTEQKDRNYFRSVYFREPGGVLFEIATDDPGFAVDEPVRSLGRALKLPAFLEAERDRIEAVLPALS